MNWRDRCNGVVPILTARGNAMPSSHPEQDEATASSPSRCLLCGGRRFRPVLSSGDRLLPSSEIFTVWRCRECGLGETYPKLTAADLAAHYPPSYPVYQPTSTLQVHLGREGGTQRVVAGLARLLYGSLVSSSLLCRVNWRLLLLRHRRLVQPLGMILPYRESPGRFLDVGCGRGHMLVSARRQGWECWGTDMNGDLRIDADIARVIYGAFEEVDLPAGFFDLVLLSHVLEHFGDPASALEKARSLLRPGGILVVAAPVRSSLEIALFGSDWYDWDVPRHQYHFTIDSLRLILHQSGFDVLSVIGDPSSNNLIGSLRYRIERCRPRLAQHVCPANPRVARPLWMLSTMLTLVGLSGRALAYARRPC